MKRPISPIGVAAAEEKSPTMPLVPISPPQAPSSSIKRKRMARTNEESYNLVKPTYIIDGEAGLRRVEPYYFEYQTYAKERWLGRSLIDVFLREFRDRPARYYREAISRGLITVNGHRVELERLVENGDLISHRLHRHEPPVTSNPIQILHDRDGLLVVDKPASIPAHPSGRYRFNTLIELLRHQTGHEHLSIINRLDRLTSGICLLSTDRRKAEELHRKMESGDYFKKEYIARVQGKFDFDQIECNLPLKVIEHKLGLVTVDEGPEGKPSKTVFNLLTYNSALDQSLVRCRPLTGRTHQIRVHLRSLGHPIVDDILYNSNVWPVDKPQPDQDELKIICRTLLQKTIAEEGNEYGNVITDSTDVDDLGEGNRVLCPECHINRADPKKEQLCIYLHAFRYSSPDWTFEAKWPHWTTMFDEARALAASDATDSLLQ